VADFQVILHGRFWVFTEAIRIRNWGSYAPHSPTVDQSITLKTKSATAMPDGTLLGAPKTMMLVSLELPADALRNDSAAG